MFWFLLVCTHHYSGGSCLPLQKMPTKAACEFTAQHYRKVADNVNAYASARCIRF